jgi:hypothetical protein
LSEMREGSVVMGELYSGVHFCDLRVDKVVKALLSELPPETVAQHAPNDMAPDTEIVLVQFQLLQTVSTAPLKGGG